MEPTKTTPSENPSTLSFEDYLREQATVAVSAILTTDSVEHPLTVTHLMTDETFVQHCAHEYTVSQGGAAADGEGA